MNLTDTVRIRHPVSLQQMSDTWYDVDPWPPPPEDWFDWDEWLATLEQEEQ